MLNSSVINCKVYKKYVKHTVDFVLALIGLLLSSPLFLIISICLALVNRGNPFFTQQRPGLNGATYRVIKFKTMTDEKDLMGKLLPDYLRLTSLGKIVRSTSLDELPQLLNVLMGQMSMIGPRPLLMQYLPLYNETQSRRHDVRPGITGWAQVHGRNTTLFSERFIYDVWYVDHLSFALDLKIILLTIKNVLLSDGVVNGQNVEDVDDLNFNKRI